MQAALKTYNEMFFVRYAFFEIFTIRSVAALAAAAAAAKLERRK